MSRVEQDLPTRYHPIVVGDDVVMTVPEGQTRKPAANQARGDRGTASHEPRWFDVALCAFVLFCLWQAVFVSGGLS